jgi:hypothetical protein
VSDEQCIVEWLETATAKGRLGRAALSGSADSLAAHLSRAGRTELARQASGLPEAGMAGDEQRAVEMLLARALAEWIARDPLPQRFEAAEQLLCADGSIWRLFCRQASDRLRRNAIALAFLRDRLAAEPDKLARSGGIEPSDLAERRRAEAAVREMWSSPGFTTSRLRSDLEHRILRGADAQAWLGIMERFVVPEPVFELVDAAGFDDMDELAAFIRNAASTFADDGSWWCDRMIIFPLVNAAERLLRRRAGLEPGAEGNATEFAADLAMLVEAIAARQDSLWLAHAWLQQLAWQDRTSKSWHQGQTAVVDDAIWKIMTALSARLSPLEKPLDWISDEKPLWRVDRVVAALLPMTLTSGLHSPAEVLAQVVNGDLVSVTGLSDAICNARNVFVRTVGAGLASAPDPVSWFRKAWHDSFLKRDRLRSSGGRQAAHGLDPGAFAAATACAALVHTADDLNGVNQSSGLWDALRMAVTELWLTTSEPRDPVWTTCARWLALSFTAAHAQSDPEARRSELRQFVAAVRAPTAEFLQLALDLSRGGVAISEVDAALDGPSLEEFAARTVDDARRQDPRGFHEKQDLANLERLQAMLLEASTSP